VARGQAAHATNRKRLYQRCVRVCMAGRGRKPNRTGPRGAGHTRRALATAESQRRGQRTGNTKETTPTTKVYTAAAKHTARPVRGAIASRLLAGPGDRSCAALKWWLPCAKGTGHRSQVLL
jgi:hypothetical protein